jgi:hypothetical protein
MMAISFSIPLIATGEFTIVMVFMLTVRLSKKPEALIIIK